MTSHEVVVGVIPQVVAVTVLVIILRRYLRDPSRITRLLAPFRNRWALAIGIAVSTVGASVAVVDAHTSAGRVLAALVWALISVGLVTAIADWFITR